MKTDQKVTLGSIVDSFDAKRSPIKGMDRIPGDVPYLGASGIVDYVEGYTHDGNFLCLSEDGENLRSRNNPIAWVQTEKFWANNHLHVFGGVDIRNLRFLSAAIAQSDIRPYLTGSTQPKLTQANALRIEVPAFPSRVRENIGELLGALDDKIAANMKYLQLLYEFIESWYVKFIEGYSLESVAVRDVAKVQLGGTPARGNPDFWGGDIPWINSGSCNLPIITKESEFISEAGLSGSSTKIICQGSTAIAITGATMGKVSYLGSDFAVNQSIVGVTPLVGEGSWVHFAIRSQVGELLKSATGAAQQHVNKKNIEELKIPYSPTLAERFGEIADVLLDKSVQIHFENQKLARTREELLPLLMDGRITVKDAERVVEEEV